MQASGSNDPPKKPNLTVKTKKPSKNNKNNTIKVPCIGCTNNTTSILYNINICHGCIKVYINTWREMIEQNFELFISKQPELIMDKVTHFITRRRPCLQKLPISPDLHYCPPQIKCRWCKFRLILPQLEHIPQIRFEAEKRLKLVSFYAYRREVIRVIQEVLKNPPRGAEYDDLNGTVVKNPTQIYYQKNSNAARNGPISSVNQNRRPLVVQDTAKNMNQPLSSGSALPSMLPPTTPQHRLSKQSSSIDEFRSVTPTAHLPRYLKPSLSYPELSESPLPAFPNNLNQSVEEFRVTNQLQNSNFDISCNRNVFNEPRVSATLPRPMNINRLEQNPGKIPTPPCEQFLNSFLPTQDNSSFNEIHQATAAPDYLNTDFLNTLKKYSDVSTISKGNFPDVNCNDVPVEPTPVTVDVSTLSQVYQRPTPVFNKKRSSHERLYNVTQNIEDHNLQPTEKCRKIVNEVYYTPASENLMPHFDSFSLPVIEAPKKVSVSIPVCEESDQEKEEVQSTNDQIIELNDDTEVQSPSLYQSYLDDDLKDFNVKNLTKYHRNLRIKQVLRNISDGFENIERIRLPPDAVLQMQTIFYHIHEDDCNDYQYLNNAFKLDYPKTLAHSNECLPISDGDELDLATFSKMMIGEVYENDSVCLTQAESVEIDTDILKQLKTLDMDMETLDSSDGQQDDPLSNSNFELMQKQALRLMQLNERHNQKKNLNILNCKLPNPMEILTQPKTYKVNSPQSPTSAQRTKIKSGRSFMARRISDIRSTDFMNKKLWRVQYSILETLITRLLILVSRPFDVNFFNFETYGENAMSIFLSGIIAEQEKFPLNVKLEFLKIQNDMQKKQHILQLMSNFDAQLKVFYIYSSSEYFSIDSIRTYLCNKIGVGNTDEFLADLVRLSNKLAELPRSMVILINFTFLYQTLPQFATGLAKFDSTILYIIESFQKAIKVLNVLTDYYNLTEFLAELSKFLHLAGELGLFDLSGTTINKVF